MRTVNTALSRVAGVQKVEYQAPDRFLVTYDSVVKEVPKASVRAVTDAGYKARIGE